MFACGATIIPAPKYRELATTTTPPANSSAAPSSSCIRNVAVRQPSTARNPATG